MHLESLVVAPETPLLAAMAVLDRAGHEVILICDDNQRLLGVCTDGDLRRHLLRGGALQDPIVSCANPTFTSVGPEVGRDECLRLMLSRGFNCLPVIDKRGILVDLHTLRNTLSTSRLPNWAVVMAGGFGTRLGELTAGIPKPMLPIGDRPILAHIVSLLVSHGIERIFLSVNYLANQIRDYFGDGSKHTCRIDYLIEDRPLGTGGSLSLLPEIPTAPLVVMNGDLLTRINLSRLLAFHRAGDFDATICLREYKVSVPFGVAEVDCGIITGLTEKPSLDYRINAGIYVLQPKLLATIPKQTAYPITELFNKVLRNKGRIGGYHMQEDWVDIGLPEEFQVANQGKG